MKYSILCIFLKTGHTFTFKDVELTVDNESALQFNYSAMSDGKWKTGNFPKANIAGWSVTSERVQSLSAKEQKP